jgi:hypothetical protein
MGKTPKRTRNFFPEKCKPNAIGRFWDKVDRTGDCWEWTASTTRGYGQFSPHNRCIIYAHRFIDIYMNGPIPDGLCTLHKCDNPACVRPSHLFRGTKGDNNRDRKAKGRYRPRAEWSNTP